MTLGTNSVERTRSAEKSFDILGRDRSTCTPKRLRDQIRDEHPKHGHLGPLSWRPAPKRCVGRATYVGCGAEETFACEALAGTAAGRSAGAGGGSDATATE